MTHLMITESDQEIASVPCLSNLHVKGQSNYEASVEIPHPGELEKFRKRFILISAHPELQKCYTA